MTQPLRRPQTLRRLRRSLPLHLAGAMLGLSLTAPPSALATPQTTEDQNRASDGMAQPAAPKTGHVGHKKDQQSKPAHIEADEMQHDKDLNSVTARGHVEVTQAGRILLADTLSYNIKQDVIVASGNVSFTDIDGQVTFADYMELTGDMKEAVIQQVKMVMVDYSRLTGKDGRRIGGTRTIMNNAQYTACKTCAEHPNDPPLWQMHAKTVTYDETQHVVEYEDMWADFAGIPFLYAPYFSHADPTVRRKSGLLPISAINNATLGTGVRTPYFQVIDDNHDDTFIPMVTTNRGQQLGVKDRWRFKTGDTTTNFSVANEDFGNRTTTGWHIDAAGQFDINDTWRTGYQVQRASDKDYLTAYGYQTSKPYLTINPYMEGFGYRTYASVEAYSFQSLSSNTSSAYKSALTHDEPVVGPLMNYNYVSDPRNNGSYWTMDAHTAAITRVHGTSSRRINTETAWHLPVTTSDGQVINFSAGMHLDGYDSENVTAMRSGSAQATRTTPTATIDWRYPMTKVGSLSSQTVTPIVVTTLTGFNANSTKIPNEDSLAFELDDSNIFSANPYAGYDRVFSGPRVAYGAEYNVTSRGLPALDLLMAQSYQAKPDKAFEAGNGMDDFVSDYVGRVGISPSTNTQFAYRFRMNKDDGTLRRSEITSTFGPQPFQLITTYVFFDKLNDTSPYNAREQLTNTLTNRLSHYWSTQFYIVENLGSGAGPQNLGGRLIYDDECFQESLNISHNHNSTTAVNHGTSIVLNFNFKTVTQLPVTVY